MLRLIEPAACVWLSKVVELFSQTVNILRILNTAIKGPNVVGGDM